MHASIFQTPSPCHVMVYMYRTALFAHHVVSLRLNVKREGVAMMIIFTACAFSQVSQQYVDDGVNSMSKISIIALSLRPTDCAASIYLFVYLWRHIYTG